MGTRDSLLASRVSLPSARGKEADWAQGATERARDTSEELVIGLRERLAAGSLVHPQATQGLLAPDTWQALSNQASTYCCPPGSAGPSSGMMAGRKVALCATQKGSSVWRRVKRAALQGGPDRNATSEGTQADHDQCHPVHAGRVFEAALKVGVRPEVVRRTVSRLAVLTSALGIPRPQAVFSEALDRKAHAGSSLLDILSSHPHLLPVSLRMALPAALSQSYKVDRVALLGSLMRRQLKPLRKRKRPSHDIGEDGDNGGGEDNDGVVNAGNEHHAHSPQLPSESDEGEERDSSDDGEMEDVANTSEELDESSGIEEDEEGEEIVEGDEDVEDVDAAEGETDELQTSEDDGGLDSEDLT